MEIDSRRLYLGEGCASMFVYCTQVLHLSEGGAYNRIEAARAARTYPLILELLEQSILTLTAIRLLAPHLTAENHRAVLASARHKSKREVESSSPSRERHTTGFGGRRRFAETSRPRVSATASADTGWTRHIPAAVRRDVWRRDAGRCAFVGREGRCRETACLEFHHVEPYAAGGEATVANIQLRCRAHNAYEARLFFGEGVARESRIPWSANSFRNEFDMTPPPRSPQSLWPARRTGVDLLTETTRLTITHSRRSRRLAPRMHLQDLDVPINRLDQAGVLEMSSA